MVQDYLDQPLEDIELAKESESTGCGTYIQAAVGILHLNLDALSI